MLKEYNTICKQIETELVEKKSRFIANVRSVSTEDEAIAFIEDKRKKYWDASHTVYAYRILTNQIKEKFSDDKEPTGTAGMPILTILRKEDVINVVVTVTRYFGGVLLGTGGLARAYGDSCKICILEAGVLHKILYEKYEVSVSYEILKKIQHDYAKNGFIIKDTQYTQIVSLIVLVKSDNVESFTNITSQISMGKAIVTFKEFVYDNNTLL